MRFLFLLLLAFNQVVSATSSALVLPSQRKQLSSDGQVAGGVLQPGNSGGSAPGGLAAVWSSATGVTTSLSPVLPVLESGAWDWANYGRSYAMVVNSSGVALGTEWHVGQGSENLGGTIAASGVGSLLGAAANASTGPFYFPAALNDTGVGVALKSWGFVDGIFTARLTVLDSGAEYDLGPMANYGYPAGGLEFQALTGGVALSAETTFDTIVLAPPVVLALQPTGSYGDPGSLVWAHAAPDEQTGSTIDWTQPAPLEYSSSGRGGASQPVRANRVRANNRLEMILGDDRLIRDEQEVHLNDRVPNAWHVNATVDINNSGVILAYATCTKRADGSDIPVGEQVSEPVLLVPSLMLLGDAPAASGDEPGFVGGLVPVVGNARFSYHYWKNGQWALSAFFAGMAVTDVTLVRSLLTSGAKVIVKGGMLLLGKDAAEEGTASAINLFDHEAVRDANGAVTRVGGHVILTHIDQEEALLYLRALHDPKVRGVASSFYNLAAAEASATQAVAEHAAEINTWLNGSARTFEMESTISSEVGIVVTKANETFVSSKTFFKLVRDPNRSPLGYYILTGYPIK